MLLSQLSLVPPSLLGSRARGLKLAFSTNSYYRRLLVVLTHRAGFTLSMALFRKKCGALQLGRQTLFFLEKKLATFF